jgi:glycine cleavage system H protein
VGAKVVAGQPFGEVESVKAVSDLYSPVDGEVIAVNTELPEHLERLSSDPYHAGWMIKVALSDDAALKRLMDAATYEKQCASEG